jgi:hypothetical protein
MASATFLHRHRRANNESNQVCEERLLAMLQRERGVDNDHDHHLVLFHLRLLDDDDNYRLFCEMERLDDELNLTLSVEQWLERRRQWARFTEVPGSREDAGDDEGLT